MDRDSEGQDRRYSDESSDDGSTQATEAEVEEYLSGSELASNLANLLQAALCPPSEAVAPTEEQLYLESRALLVASPSPNTEE